MRRKERNTKIEIIRIVACFLVIINHIQVVTATQDDIFFMGRSLVYNVIRMNVPLFLLISGFLLFQSVDDISMEQVARQYIKKLCNFVIYTFIPSLAVVVISAIFYSFIVDGSTLIEVFQIRDFKWEYITDYLFRQQGDYICVHLWYIWAYIKILICFPVLTFICQDNRYISRIRYAFIIIAAAVMIYIDYSVYMGQNVTSFSDMTQLKYLLYVVIGYELYLFVSNAKNRFGINLVIGLGLLLIGLVGGTIYEKKYFTNYLQDCTSILMIMISSAGAFLLLYSIKELKCKRLIQTLGKSTLYIYLVHLIVIFRYRTMFEEKFWTMTGSGKNIFAIISYDILYGVVIFVIAFIFGLILQMLYEKIIVSGVQKLVFKKKEDMSE